MPTEPTASEQKFPSVFDWKTVESRVQHFTKEADLHGQVSKALGSKPRVGYVEGPPTLNGVPHIGHIRGRIMEDDLWYRYSTLLLKENVVFRAGWDCQGLPVELQAEKELGLSGNKWEGSQADRRGEARRGLQTASRQVPAVVGGRGRPPGPALGPLQGVHDLQGRLHRTRVEVPREGMGEEDPRRGFQGRTLLPQLHDVSEPRRGSPGLRDAGGHPAYTTR